MDLKSMSTEALKEFLREDCNSEHSELGEEELFAVMSELALREGKSSEAEAKEAWQRFMKYWVPGVDISSLANICRTKNIASERRWATVPLVKSNPNDLISRNAVIEKLQSKFPDEGWGPYFDGISDAVECIDQEPAVDAAPVKYEHWIPREPNNPDSRYYYCSGCKADIKKEKALYYRFCPECGAAMNRKATLPLG